jgi:hypothetical protein
MGAIDIDWRIISAFGFSKMVCEVVDIELLDRIKQEKFLD